MLKTKALVLFLNLLLFNLIIAKYVKNRNDEIVKFIDFEGQSFFRNKTVNGKLIKYYECLNSFRKSSAYILQSNLLLMDYQYINRLSLILL